MLQRDENLKAEVETVKLLIKDIENTFIVNCSSSHIHEPVNLVVWGGREIQIWVLEIILMYQSNRSFNIFPGGICLFLPGRAGI